MNKYQEALNKVYEIISDLDFGSQKECAIQLKMIQELVDKETPKKPIRFKNSIYISLPKCPICKTIPHTGNQKYCDECGQKLDWSETCE